MKKGVLYIILAAFLFSTMEIALKLFSAGFNPLQLNFIRFSIGSVTLLPFAIKTIRKRGVHLNLRELGFFALTGFICVVVSMTFFQLAVMEEKASTVAILFCCNPVFVVPLARLLLGERIRRLTAVSMLISIAGVVLIMDPFNITAAPSGIILTLVAAATFALYNVIGRSRTARFGGVAFTAFSFISGSIEMLLIILFSRLEPVALFLQSVGLAGFADIPLIQGVTLQSLPGLFYIGVFVTGLGYVFYLLSMEETSAAKASTVFFIKPALAPILAFLILGEAVSGNVIAGMLLIIAGSFMNFLPGVLACFNAKRLRPGEGKEPAGQ